jgi:hypothetical protein
MTMNKTMNVLADSVSIPRRTLLAREMAKVCAGVGVAATLSFALMPGLAAADDAKKPATFDFQGYVDAAYSHLSEGGSFGFDTGEGIATSGASRVFDTGRDTFTLNQAALFVNVNAMEKWGGYLNLTAGKDAGIIKSIDQSGDNFDVTQAYMRYAGDKTTFIAGKFTTLAGAELIDSRGLPVYSRSILFGYALPFTHTGVRATFAPNKSFSFTVGANNGWDQMKDTNDNKTLELGMAITPMSGKISLLASYYSGKEGPLGFTGTRDLLDVVLSITPNDKLGIIFNYDDGSQKTPFGGPSQDWNGWAGYVKYKFNDSWGFLFRTESFDDKDGYRTGVVQKWKESTVAFTASPTASAEIRLEARFDKSDNNTFFNDKDGTLHGSQNSYAVEFLYKF